MDTGAQCNTLPAELVSELNLDLSPCNTKLHSYSGHEVIPVGKTTANVFVRGQSSQLEFIIVPENYKPVIGGDDCLKLGLLSRQNVNSVSEVTPTTAVNLDDYKDLFDGLGCIEGEHH